MSSVRLNFQQNQVFFFKHSCTYGESTESSSWLNTQKVSTLAQDINAPLVISTQKVSTVAVLSTYSYLVVVLSAYSHWLLSQVISTSWVAQDNTSPSRPVTHITLIRLFDGVTWMWQHHIADQETAGRVDLFILSLKITRLRYLDIFFRCRTNFRLRLTLL